MSIQTIDQCVSKFLFDIASVLVLELIAIFLNWTADVPRIQIIMVTAYQAFRICL